MSGWSGSGGGGGSRRGRGGGGVREVGRCPNKAVLHEAALGYLARGAATAVTLSRVLQRRISTWARRAGRAAVPVDPEVIAAESALAEQAIVEILARFREVGLINDTTYAESRVRSLTRAGRSRRAIAAHLAAKGVAAETVRETLPNDANLELAAALAFARKRRCGPYAREEEDRAAKQKALAAMARGGFGWSVCERVFAMDREQADERLSQRD